MCVCVCVCIYIYIYGHTHTHTDTPFMTIYIYIYIYIYVCRERERESERERERGRDMKGAEYFVSLLPRWCSVMVNTHELIGTAGYLTLQARCRIKRCRYNRVRLYIYIYIYISAQFYILGICWRSMWKVFQKCLQIFINQQGIVYRKTRSLSAVLWGRIRTSAETMDRVGFHQMSFFWT